MSDVDVDNGRKNHLQELKDTDKIRFSWNELKTLMDARNKFKEQTDWRREAECTIDNVKDKLKYQLSESDFDVLAGEKAGIRRLSKDASIKNVCADFVRRRNEFQEACRFVVAENMTIVHDHWVERENDREWIARDITECLMQLIKTNSFHRISRGSENTLVEVVARLIDVSIYQLPINRINSEVEVTRNERQSVASKNRKAKQKNGARGNRPDFMIQAFLGQKWNEIVQSPAKRMA
ncbi:8377_t:CDS:2, partial [Ambispora leptoticha]